MLEIKVGGGEIYNEATNEFIQVKPQILKLEHSLLSVSKWESKWHKAFLEDEKSTEEVGDYIKCMTINQVDPSVYLFLTQDDVDQIKSYIEDSMTATTITDLSPQGTRKRVTSELIYYWMVALQIPFECEKWHLNRLLTLIKVTNIMNKPAKENRMPPREAFERQRMLNEANRKRFHLKG